MVLKLFSQSLFVFLFTERILSEMCLLLIIFENSAVKYK